MQTLKIQAAVLRKRGGFLKIETIEMEGPRDEEVLVRLVASGICHTDITFCEQWVRADGPLVLGHEGAGVVEQVGRHVRGVRPGDHVVLSYQSCGRCPSCQRRRPTECERFWDANFGFERLDGSNGYEGGGVRGHFFGQSSFATYTLATKQNLVKVSKDLPLELLAPLGCGIQTGAGTVMNSLKVRKGTSIAIFGTGAVGLSAVMAAHIVGADPIIGVDIKPKRLELALALGATHVIDSRRNDVAGRIGRITGGGVDHVLEITGNPKMYRLAVSLLNPNGTVAIFTGEGGGADLKEGRKSLSIIEGDAVPQRFIPKLIKLYLEGRFPFDRLVRFYPFSHINRAMADARRGTTVKPILRISDPQAI
jgi:aryl-alcohol dehydrogenase